jgi:hypothetical protein
MKLIVDEKPAFLPLGRGGGRGVQSTRSRFDRHRGGGHPPTPATPPCERVRTRRFESVTLTVLEQ